MRDKKTKLGLGIALFVVLFFVWAGIDVINASAENREKVDVLIGFAEMPEAAERGLVNKFGGEIDQEYDNFPVISASLPNEAASALSDHPSVRYVELNKKVYALSYDDPKAEYDNPWGIEHINSGLVHDNGFTGDSIKVAIIDSGVDHTHRDLESNFVTGDLGYDFVEEDEYPMDVYGHGTHVAGTVAAARDDFGVVGMAPEVQLIALRILNDDGVGDQARTIAALDWILGYNQEHPDSPIRITNNSYGRGSEGDALGEAFQKLEQAGVLHLAAAGNSGNPGGNNDSLIYPAKYDSVMAVGAVNENNIRPNWSSTGPDLEVVAPGDSVLSTWNNETAYTDVDPFSFDEDQDTYYKEGSGTSMASPHVAGVAALAWSVDQNLTNTQIRTHLKETAKDIGATQEYGNGLVQADSVLELEPKGTGFLAGSVTDTEAEAIEGVTVEIEETGETATTDAGGDYLMEDLVAGDYEVTASQENYEPQTRSVTIDEDRSTEQNFTLAEIETYTISGTVTSNDNPLEEATVTLEETGLSTTTANDGTYSMDEVKEGEYSLTANKDGYLDQTRSVTIDSNATVDLKLEEKDVTAPKILTVEIEDTSNPAWTRAEITWRVSGEDLETVELQMFDQEGGERDSKTMNVSGSEAEGVDELRSRAGGSYVVITVTDQKGGASESDPQEF